MEERQEMNSTTTAPVSSRPEFGGMDDEFVRGLESIIGPMRQAGASEDEIAVITARARQFYLARAGKKEVASVGLENSSASQEGRISHAQDIPMSAEPSSREAALAPGSSSAAASEDQPTYPLSFDQLAEMIATGQPVPGIRDIPNKLNDAAPSEAVIARTHVRKPWESSNATGPGAPLASVLQQQQ